MLVVSKGKIRAVVSVVVVVVVSSVLGVGRNVADLVVGVKMVVILVVMVVILVVMVVILAVVADRAGLAVDICPLLMFLSMVIHHTKGQHQWYLVQ